MVSGARDLCRVGGDLPGNKQPAHNPECPVYLLVSQAMQTILSFLIWELVALKDEYDTAR